MAVRRVGSNRLPDNRNNVWSVSAPNSIPGDVLSGAPNYGGQSLRESPGPIITESEMAVHEVKEAPTRAKAGKPKLGRKPRVRAVLPAKASRTVMVPAKDALSRTAINLRVPTKLLQRFKDGGAGYQGRIVAVLELFVQEGGTFTEE